VTATTGPAWTTEEIRVAESTLCLRTGGAGDPLLVLSHDIGSLERLPFYDALARRFTVYLPSHPGYDGSERPNWMRSVRDVAVTYQSLLAAINLANVSLVATRMPLPAYACSGRKCSPRPVRWARSSASGARSRPTLP
jgi:pimeloyl-ACP methyl ester carboxylesterase